MPVVSRLRRVPPLWVLLTATAVLYLWGLSSAGWANAYYSAAAQAGSQSWTAFFFGSFDAAGSITVDKPPLSLWPMALSVRLFGLSSWSILAPQAVMGVATVAVVHAGVRRATGSSGVALLAGATTALTPVAVLMFRFNNPDGLLVLLLSCAAVATLRAVDETRDGAGRPVRWLALAGLLVGLGFLTKMLQAFLVLPALALTYLLCAAVPWGRRVAHLGVAAVTTVVGGSWWLIAVDLWPADSRPWIGGSQHNSVLELVVGYNGLGRLTGDQVGAVSGPQGWGHNTLLRLLDPTTGGQAAWLLPAATVLGVAALWLVWRDPTPETLRARPTIVLWLGWTLVTWLVFSLMNGIFHDYYTVALAPAIASAGGVGAWVLWQHRGSVVATRVLGLAVLATTVMALTVLWPQRGWQPWLPVTVTVAAVIALCLAASAHRRAVPLGGGFVVIALVTALAGPAAYSVETVGQAPSGAVPHAGPDSPRARAATGRDTVSPVGTLLQAGRPSPTLVRLLTRDADAFTWVAAVTGANSAAGFQLATGRPVMPVGGFNGTDPAPGLPAFRRLVREGRIHWYVAGGGLLRADAGAESAEVSRSGSDSAVRIAQWVRTRFEARRVDGVVVHDLTRPRAGAG
ncbi:glycosyltransferase family 39 protein [Nocardioides marinquilinus]|uniref:Glycosyltransferase family 39 protein n=1 Tax=Nocardioides marinquilinus TaxID=1210400 RepID=A0ABP9PI03_9ACTN